MAHRPYAKGQVQGSRTPKHYSKFLNDENGTFVKAGWVIMALVVLFLAFVILSALAI